MEKRIMSSDENVDENYEEAIRPSIIDGILVKQMLRKYKSIYKSSIDRGESLDHV